MKILIALILSFFTSLGWAQHREHGAHVHGAGKLSIAFDQTKGKLEFQTPAISVVGFEHPAKSAKDKKTVADALVAFEKQIQSLVQLSPQLNCTFKKDKVEVKADEDGDHSDFLASFDLVCSKSPVGTLLKVDFSKYPAMKDVDVTVLVDNLQKTAEVKSKPVEIELKP